MRYEYRIICKPTGAWVWGSWVAIRSRRHAQNALERADAPSGCSTYTIEPPYDRQPPHAHRMERRAVGAWEPT